MSQNKTCIVFWRLF